MILSELTQFVVKHNFSVWVNTWWNRMLELLLLVFFAVFFSTILKAYMMNSVSPMANFINFDTRVLRNHPR